MYPELFTIDGREPSYTIGRLFFWPFLLLFDTLKDPEKRNLKNANKPRETRLISIYSNFLCNNGSIKVKENMLKDTRYSTKHINFPFYFTYSIFFFNFNFLSRYKLNIIFFFIIFMSSLKRTHKHTYVPMSIIIYPPSII